MKIELEFYGDPFCLSKTCVFNRECANHETAGDYRSEDGFKPEIVEINGEYYCNTADQLPKDDDRLYRIPNNYDKLDYGILTLKELQINSIIDYNI